jgi:hypothetical protein
MPTVTRSAVPAPDAPVAPVAPSIASAAAAKIAGSAGRLGGAGIQALPYSSARAASAMTFAEATMSSITTYSSG